MPAIAPITAPWLPTVLLIGHSNADGWAASDKLFEDFADFFTLAGGLAGDAKADPANAYWPNVYVFTSSQPFPGGDHTPVTSEITTGEWLEMTIANVRDNGDPHPHAHPFNYPNVRGSCYPRFMYNAWEPSGFDGFHHTPSSSATWGTLIGVEVPLQFYWRNYWQTQVGFVKVAFSSTLALPADSGGDPDVWLDPLDASQEVGAEEVPSAVDPDLGSQYGYWSPQEQFDFSPATDRLFKLTIDKLGAAAAAMPAGSRMDVRLIVPWVGDNDSVVRLPATLQSSWLRSLRTMIERIRQEIDDNGWSQIPAAQIPVVLPGVYLAYVNQVDSDFDSVAFMIEAAQTLALNDSKIGFVDSHLWTVLSSANPLIPADDYEPVGITGNSHFGHTGYVTAAQEIMAMFQQLEDGDLDALAENDRITLEEVREDVKLRYDRGKNASDLGNDVLNAFINQAIRSIFNYAGPNAWWAERRIEIDIQTDSSYIATMPGSIAYVAWIENPCDPKRPLDFTQIGFGRGGRALLQFDCPRNSTFKCHVISWPRRVGGGTDSKPDDDQVLPIPRQLSEWLVLETCRRMAAGGTDVAARAMFAGEEAVERVRAMNTISNVLVGRKDALHSAEPPLRFGY